MEEGLRGLADHVRIIQTSPSPAEVDEAMRTLEPFVVQSARRVCLVRRVVRRIEDEFVPNAPSFVWEKIKLYDPTRGEFAGWLWRLLENRLKDERARILRSDARVVGSQTREGDDLLAALEERRASDPGATMDRGAEFGDGDLDRIRSWPVRDRLRLLAGARLHQKVGREEWESWCSNEAVTLPFPPDDHAAAGSIIAWLKLVAEAMEEPWESFKQHWYRKKQARLIELSYVREIIDGG
jgi:hypothetical protein